MGSAGQAEAGTTPIHPPGAARIADLLLRIGLFVAVLVALGVRFDGRSIDAVGLPLVIVGTSVGVSLLLATPATSALVRAGAQRYPLLVGLGAALLALPSALLTPAKVEFDPADLIFGAALLLLPVGCAVLNTPELRRGDIGLGLSTTALPILLPLTRDARSPFALSLSAGDLALRLGAFLLPLAFVLLTTPRQKQRLNFLLLCAALSLWYGVKFGAFPDVPIDPAVDLNYFHAAAIVALLYALAAAGWLPGVGFQFHASARELGVAALGLMLIAAPTLGVGLLGGFLKPEMHQRSLAEALISAGGIYLFVALPEEVLFRGVLLRHLHTTLSLPALPALMISAVVFGGAHLNALADAGWRFALSVLAGFICGWVFLSTGKVTVSALVHAAVSWIGWGWAWG